MNIDYTLTESTNSDISFIDFNKFLNYLIFEKSNQYHKNILQDIESGPTDIQSTIIEYFSNNNNDLKKIKEYNDNILDKQTKNFVKKIVKKYNLEDLLKLNLKELKDIKYKTENEFNKNHENIKEKMNKLRLIQRILNIDLNYYQKQIENINKILKNQNFKEEIENINEKILSNIDINNDEMNKINFYHQLVKQESYIKYVILSSENKLYTKSKTILKNKIVEEMKTIEDETKIYLKDEDKDKKIDYNKVMKLWNENKLKKLFEKVDMEVMENKNLMNLKYQLIENFKLLTKKSYTEINLIIKDRKFKEKIFENINIDVINNKLNELKEDNKQYEKINSYLEKTKTPIHVCPICNFKSDMPIETLLHLSIHKNEDKLEVQRFYTYKDNNQKLKSKFSEKNIDNMNKHFYEMKKKLLKSETIEDFTLVTSVIPIKNRINIQRIQYKINKEQSLLEYKENILSNYKNHIKIFPNGEKIIDIIESRINREIERHYDNELFNDENDQEELENFSHLNKILNYHISRLILDQYLNDNDVSNLYNTNIEYFDNNLKNNNSIDILFKNIIHYNTFEPMQSIKDIVNSFMRIIDNTRDLENMLFVDSSNKTYQKFDKKGQATRQTIVAEVEVSEYLDYKTLILLIPILRNRNFTLAIQNLIRSDDFEINDDDENLYHPWKWVQKSDYNKMIGKISNIKKQDINIKEIENDESDDYKRLHQLFKNIEKTELKKIKKEFELVTHIFESFLRQNRVSHDINSINNDKDINGKYKEYIIGSYLKTTLNILNKIVKNNIDNTTNTKREIGQLFNILSIYLNKKSMYLQKSRSNYQRNIRVAVPNNTEEKNNKDDILNEYFESDEEYESDIEDNIEDNFEQQLEDDLNEEYSDEENDFIVDEEDLFE